MALDDFVRSLGRGLLLPVAALLTMGGYTSCTNLTGADVAKIATRTAIVGGAINTPGKILGATLIEETANAASAHELAQEGAPRTNVYVGTNGNPPPASQEAPYDQDNILWDSRVRDVNQLEDKIVFVLPIQIDHPFARKHRSTQYEIFTANADGSQVQRRTYTPFCDERRPVLGSDGKTVSFDLQHTNTVVQACKLGLKTTSSTQHHYCETHNAFYGKGKSERKVMQVN